MTTKYVSLEEVIKIVQNNFWGKGGPRLQDMVTDLQQAKPLESKIDTLQRYGMKEIYGNKAICGMSNGDYLLYEDLLNLLSQGKK